MPGLRATCTQCKHAHVEHNNVFNKVFQSSVCACRCLSDMLMRGKLDLERLGKGATFILLILMSAPRVRGVSMGLGKVTIRDINIQLRSFPRETAN